MIVFPDRPHHDQSHRKDGIDGLLTGGGLNEVCPCNHNKKSFHGAIPISQGHSTCISICTTSKVYFEKQPSFAQNILSSNLISMYKVHSFCWSFLSEKGPHLLMVSTQGLPLYIIKICTISRLTCYDCINFSSEG